MATTSQRRVAVLVATVAAVAMASALRLGAAEAVAAAGVEEAYPDWSTDKFGVAEADPTKAEPAEAVAAAAGGGGEASGGNLSAPRVTTLSWKPRAFVYHNFLSSEECDHIIALARPRLERSEVVAQGGNGTNVDDVRTSFGTFLDYQQDDVVRHIEERIATWTFLPIANQEAMQVLRYQDGQKYEAHHDFFEKPAQGGHRYATVLLYLTEGFKGGETVFPQAKDSVEKDDTWSDCGKQGVAAKPHKGDALLFFSLTPSAEPDLMSLHAGCPVTDGEKWSATKWIHVDSFYSPPGSPPAPVDPTDDGDCRDVAEHCAYWTKNGECTNNVEYMSLNCAKSCGVCSVKAS